MPDKNDSTLNITIIKLKKYWDYLLFLHLQKLIFVIKLVINRYFL